MTVGNERRLERDDILGILAKHRAKLAEVGIGSLALFGSFARGEAGSESDVDLLGEFPRLVGLFEVVDMKGGASNICLGDLFTWSPMTA